MNNTVDMFRDMRNTVLLQRINSMDPFYPRAEEAIEMATITGAKALGMEDRIGSIEEGKKADIVLLNKEKSSMIPVHDSVSSVV